MKLKNRAPGMFRETGPYPVQRDYGVRPNKPDIVQTRCRWIIGDVTEVLDHNTWKLGKIAKIVENDYFVIRLADCIQLKEFHISSLRVPVPQDPPTATIHCNQFPAADKANRRGKQLPADVLRRSGKKRKSSAVLDSPEPMQRKFTSEYQRAAHLQHRHPQYRRDRRVLGGQLQRERRRCGRVRVQLGRARRRHVRRGRAVHAVVLVVVREEERGRGRGAEPERRAGHGRARAGAGGVPVDGAGAPRVGAADVGAGVAAHQPPPLPQHLQRGAPPPAPAPPLFMISHLLLLLLLLRRWRRR